MGDVPQNTSVPKKRRVRGRNKSRHPMILGVDERTFQRVLERDDLTDEQKAEFLRTMSAIISVLIGLGYRVRPVQKRSDLSEMDRSILETVDKFFGHVA